MDPWSAAAYAGVNAGASLFGQNSAQSFSALEAEKNRRFQRGMANTAHQREAKDLEVAGLNRILGYSKGGGGASTPSGAQGQGFDPKLGSAVSDGINTAISGEKVSEEIEKIQQDVLIGKQDELVKKWQAEINKNTAGITGVGGELGKEAESLVVEGIDIVKTAAKDVNDFSWDVWNGSVNIINQGIDYLKSIGKENKAQRLERKLEKEFGTSDAKKIRDMQKVGLTK